MDNQSGAQTPLKTAISPSCTKQCLKDPGGAVVAMVCPDGIKPVTDCPGGCNTDSTDCAGSSEASAKAAENPTQDVAEQESWTLRPCFSETVVSCVGTSVFICTKNPANPTVKAMRLKEACPADSPCGDVCDEAGVIRDAKCGGTCDTRKNSKAPVADQAKPSEQSQTKPSQTDVVDACVNPDKPKDTYICLEGQDGKVAQCRVNPAAFNVQPGKALPNMWDWFSYDCGTAGGKAKAFCETNKNCQAALAAEASQSTKAVANALCNDPELFDKYACLGNQGGLGQCRIDPANQKNHKWFQYDCKKVPDKNIIARDFCKDNNQCSAELNQKMTTLSAKPAKAVCQIGGHRVRSGFDRICRQLY